MRKRTRVFFEPHCTVESNGKREWAMHSASARTYLHERQMLGRLSSVKKKCCCGVKRGNGVREPAGETLQRQGPAHA